MQYLRKIKIKTKIPIKRLEHEGHEEREEGKSEAPDFPTPSALLRVLRVLRVFVVKALACGATWKIKRLDHEDTKHTKNKRGGLGICLLTSLFFECFVFFVLKALAPERQPNAGKPLHAGGHAPILDRR